MNPSPSAPATCDVCGLEFEITDLVPGALVRDVILQAIRIEHPDFGARSRICRDDINRIRGDYVHALLESEKGDLTSLEKEVLQSLEEHDLLARNVDDESRQDWSRGEKLADRLASLGGSWSFLIAFAVLLAIWITYNSLPVGAGRFDPFPFILLNLLLSLLAAIQAPVIMMSQNRQESKDRVRQRHDYQVNLKAELEIRHLHEKVDHLLSHQWERLTRIQEIQLEMLAELGKRK